MPGARRPFLRFGAPLSLPAGAQFAWQWGRLLSESGGWAVPYAARAARWSVTSSRLHRRPDRQFPTPRPSVGLIGSIVIAFVGAMVLIAPGHVASSLARLFFATGIPAVAMAGLVT
jgi:hypothetical protein